MKINSKDFGELKALYRKISANCQKKSYRSTIRLIKINVNILLAVSKAC